MPFHFSSFLRFVLLLVTLPACTIRLINVPGEETGVSNESNLNVAVESSQYIVEYQFRLVPAESPDADCEANLGSYSLMQPRDTNLVQDFSALPDGPLKLCVRAKAVATPPGEDEEKTYFRFATAAWTKDTTPPSAFAITGPVGTQGINTPTVTWEAADGASSYTLDITSDAACENIFRTYPDLATTSHQIAEGIPNGFWHLCVKAEDLGGNTINATNNGILMTVDAPFLYMFTTSTAFTGSEMVSIDNMDDQCSLHAFIGNLIPDWNGVDRVYKAVLSDSTVHAKDRFVLNKSIFNRNNQLIGFGNALWIPEISTSPSYDENGSLLGNVSIWTGSNSDGTYSGNFCSDWSSSAGLGTAGQADAEDSTLFNNGNFACSESKRVYCIGPF